MSNYPDGFDDSLLDEPAPYGAEERAASDHEDATRNASLDDRIDAANAADFEARMMLRFGDRWVADRTRCWAEVVAEHRALTKGAA